MPKTASMRAAYRKHCAWLLEHEPAGFFAAGGTGEFFSLRLRMKLAR